MKNLLDTVYLGDRACKSILIDGWNSRVVFQINVISRIRSESGEWNYYTDEDIVDGYIVFNDVQTLHFNPPGYMPNDLIELIDVKQFASSNEQDAFLVRFSIDSVDASGRRTEVIVELVAGSVHLEDPARPGIRVL